MDLPKVGRARWDYQPLWQTHGRLFTLEHRGTLPMTQATWPQSTVTDWSRTVPSGAGVHFMYPGAAAEPTVVGRVAGIRRALLRPRSVLWGSADRLQWFPTLLHRRRMGA